MENLENKRIALLLSGGVDSSVVLHELCEKGVKPDCFYIKIGPEEDEEWDCSSEEDMEMATAVAARYGCRLEVVDCHKEYWDQVTRYTMDKVRAGLTPNPDVMCNRLIKFGAFDEKAGHDYDLIATGHYAQTEIEDGKKWLVTAPDPVKDQTDFLAQIETWQLKKALFPIGHYMKEEVRAIAEREHLVNARRKDSQGICKLIGKHRGLWFHTIGQRHGLGFGGGPWYVVKKDVEKNVLYVSKGYEPLTAYKDTFQIHHFHFLTEKVEMKEVTFKIRHTPEFHPAVLEPTGDGAFTVHASHLIQGVAPGQFCVVYDSNHHRCYGSAEITV